MKTIALIIAGGVGARMGQEIPKQFLTIDDKPVIAYTMEAFQRHPRVDSICVVCVEGWETMLKAYARQFGISKLDYVVTGGENGQDSIRNGALELEKHFESEDIILLHDGIRPMVSAEIISNCIDAAAEHGMAITVIPCAEGMLTTDDAKTSKGSYPRDGLKRCQTPQGFKLSLLCDLERRALDEGITNSITPATLAVDMGEEVFLCQGSERNVKLTTTEDIEIFKALLASERPSWMR